MELAKILSALGALTALALAILFGWLGAKPAGVLAKPRPPWRILMLFSFAVSVIMLMFLVDLFRPG